MVTVVAVVVTYNRVSKLGTVLDSIDKQDQAPERVVVINNASTDGTAEFLRKRVSEIPYEIVSMDANVGGAGGFAEGMLRGYQSGADFVWIMDDDCYPRPGALSSLVRGFDLAVDELGAEVPFACSVVKFTDDSICEMNNPVPTWDWGRLLVKSQNAVMVTACSFVSMLIPRWAMAEYGLPYRDYFIWFDDREYSLRLSARCPGVQVLDSVVVHDMGDNKGVNFSMVNAGNIWKFEYGVRNEASWLIHHRGVLYFAEFAARLGVSLHRGKVPLRLRFSLFKSLVRGVRFNPSVEYPGDGREFVEIDRALQADCV